MFCGRENVSMLLGFMDIYILYMGKVESLKPVRCKELRDKALLHWYLIVLYLGDISNVLSPIYINMVTDLFKQLLI